MNYSNLKKLQNKSVARTLRSVLLARGQRSTLGWWFRLIGIVAFGILIAYILLRVFVAIYGFSPDDLHGIPPPLSP